MEDPAAQLHCIFDEPNLKLILVVCGCTKSLWRTPINASGPHRAKLATALLLVLAGVARIADLALEPSVAD